MCRNADLPASLDEAVVRAAVAVRAYRENHKITPVRRVVDVATTDGKVAIQSEVCDHDGIAVYPIRRGYRHNMTLVADLSKIAGPLA